MAGCRNIFSQGQDMIDEEELEEDLEEDLEEAEPRSAPSLAELNKTARKIRAKIVKKKKENK